MHSSLCGYMPGVTAPLGQPHAYEVGGRVHILTAAVSVLVVIPDVKAGVLTMRPYVWVLLQPGGRLQAAQGAVVVVQRILHATGQARVKIQGFRVRARLTPNPTSIRRGLPYSSHSTSYKPEAR